MAGQALVGLARSHPAALVEQACVQALADGLSSLKAITLMVNELACKAQAPQTVQLTQQHSLIRDAGDYAAFFAAAADQARTGERLQ